MPVRTFVCNSCGQEQTRLMRLSERVPKRSKCLNPDCGKRSVRLKFDTCAISVRSDNWFERRAREREIRSRPHVREAYETGKIVEMHKDDILSGRAGDQSPAEKPLTAEGRDQFGKMIEDSKQECAVELAKAGVKPTDAIAGDTAVKVQQVMTTLRTRNATAN